MKKVIFLTMVLAAQVSAGEPSTSDKKTVGDFIKAGGFHALCNRLNWQWGYIDGNSPACFSDRYAQRNGWRYNPANGYWSK